MDNEFVVVGEYKADNRWLLVQGTDGQHYGYHPNRNRLIRVELDERWERYAATERVVEALYPTKAH
jgi:hypothetical protein